jgi:N-acyl-L-homoserine lactone synthetase
LQQLETLDVGKATRDVLGDILRSAANPDAERVDVVISTLSQERQENVGKTMRKIGQFGKSITKRGAAGLMDISDDEFQRLIDEANDAS